MAIEVTCSNILRYDHDSGQYVRCGARITVQTDQIGTKIRCPQCGAVVEAVPPQVEQAAEPSGDELEELEDVEVASVLPDWSAQPVTKARPTRGPRQIPCINCHQPLPVEAEVCPACGHQQPTAPVAGEPVGFERWFRGFLAEGASPVAVLLLAALLCGVLMVLCVGYTIVIYGRWALLWVAPLVPLALAWLAVVALNRWPDESWWAAARRVSHPWTALLLLNRACGWRQPRWPFRRRRILDRRDSNLDDDQLLAIEDLDEYQVMDLEGTSITDAALQELRYATALEFLVVLRTGVTAEGVEQLQQFRPEIWIWS